MTASVAKSALIFFMVVVLGNLDCQAAAGSPKTKKYEQYIGRLLQVRDFGMHYYEDGAADASVLFPSNDSQPYDTPRPAVLELVRLRERSVPLLIDCLSDGRLTSIHFDGNVTTKEMRVPVGYVCLDILLAVTRGKPSAGPDCESDGLGACIKWGFYFRPDDYFGCTRQECKARPWVKVVQKTWRREFLLHQLHFVNPYNGQGIQEYGRFADPKN
jgi:hypothetical protein